MTQCRESRLTERVPARSVADLVARAKAEPGGLNCGIAGAGSSQHFAAARRRWPTWCPDGST